MTLSPSTAGPNVTTTTTTTTTTINDDVESIESLEALTTHDEDSMTAPPIAAKKVRSGRRFFNDYLLCCFGISKKSSSSVPLQADLSSTCHYQPKLSEKLLLPPIRPCDINKKCVIVDLDETLVHSSFKPVKNPDFVIPVEIDGVVHQVYVLKRPNVDEFLQRIGSIYECVLFTASLAKYADPVADLLDKSGIFRARLFREACVFHKGNYVKDLNRLGRDLKQVVIVDNSPASYAFHPDNAVPVQSWFDDMNDTELLDIVPLLDQLSKVDNVYSILRNSSICKPSSQLASSNNAANEQQQRAVDPSAGGLGDEQNLPGIAIHASSRTLILSDGNILAFRKCDNVFTLNSTNNNNNTNSLNNNNINSSNNNNNAKQNQFSNLDNVIMSVERTTVGR